MHLTSSQSSYIDITKWSSKNHVLFSDDGKEAIGFALVNEQIMKYLTLIHKYLIFWNSCKPYMMFVITMKTCLMVSTSIPILNFNVQVQFTNLNVGRNVFPPFRQHNKLIFCTVFNFFDMVLGYKIWPKNKSSLNN